MGIDKKMDSMNFFIADIVYVGFIHGSSFGTA